MQWQVVLALHSADDVWVYYTISPLSYNFITYQGLKSLINRKLKEGKKIPACKVNTAWIQYLAHLQQGSSFPTKT